jgi:hypothetical protein
MAFRLRVLSSSLCPPDRNMMPGTAGGTRRRSRFSVYLATWGRGGEGGRMGGKGEARWKKCQF